MQNKTEANAAQALTTYRHPLRKVCLHLLQAALTLRYVQVTKVL